MSEHSKARRNRAILSCNDCRRRKLKCDRLSPCNRCIKGGIAESCAYGPEAHSVPPEELQERPSKKQRRNPRASRPSTEDGHASEAERDVPEQNNAKSRPDTVAQERLEQLERDIAILQQRVPNQVQEPKDQVDFLAHSPEMKGIGRSSARMGMLKGRGFATHLYGPSSAMSIIAHFPDLRSFMKAAYSESAARRLSQDLKASEDRARLMRPQHRVLSVSSLRALLPDRPTVDAILSKYFDTFETTFRIVHVPTFKAAYSTYWDNNSAKDVDMDALVLAILACTICTSTHTSPRYNHIGSTFHSKAILWVRACEAWLRRQSNKHRTLITLQVRCLRLLALATGSMKVKEYYQEVQAHVALMRSAGMHRDPSIFDSRCSVFERELRRRLWATTMELELQASVDKGVPSILRCLDHDCAPPRNIDDSELHPDLVELPRSYGITTYTEASYLHVAMQSLELRVSICSKINGLEGNASLQDTLEDEDTLRQHIANIPRWTGTRSIQATNLLELQLQQSIVVLHASRTSRVELRRRSEYRYAMITALEAATATIDLHTSQLKSGNFSLILTRSDYFRAILLICHVAYYAYKDNDTMMMRLTKQIFDESQEKALHLQEERAMRPGRGTEYFWYVSASISLVSIQFQTTKSEVLKRQAADRVAKLLYRVLALQDDPSEETLATEILLAEQLNAPPSLSATIQSFPEFQTADSFADAGVRLDAFDVGDTSEFLMDDLWFLNVPPLDFDSQVLP